MPVRSASLLSPFLSQGSRAPCNVPLRKRVRRLLGRCGPSRTGALPRYSSRISRALLAGDTRGAPKTTGRIVAKLKNSGERSGPCGTPCALRASLAAGIEPDNNVARRHIHLMLAHRRLRIAFSLTCDCVPGQSKRVPSLQSQLD